MPEKRIEEYIVEFLIGETQMLALDFVTYLRVNEMQFEKAGGYWEDKLYWCINYNDKSVCYILIEENSWTVWSDDSGDNSYENSTLDERMKEIAWSKVGVCENVNRCFDGCSRSSKSIFGKEFDNVCGTAMKFENPDAETVDCMKKIIKIRKIYIEKIMEEKICKGQ